MHNGTREEMSSLDHYFFLSDGKVIVNGSKKSVLLDLKNGKIYSVNSSARRIINLGEQGYKIVGAIERLSTELEASDVISFLKELSGLGMVQFSECRKQRKPDKVPLPKLDFLWIEVTSRCNLRCVHCYAEAESNAIKAEQHIDISLEEFKRVIDEAAGLNCQKLQLTGGEPTLRDDLRELITYANASGFKIIEIFTNGTHLTESMIQFFADTGVHVAVSIHSYCARTHDAITRVPGSFERTLNSIKLLRAHGVSTRCATIAMKQNENELDETSYFLSQLGVHSAFPDPIRPSGRGRDMENWPHRYGLNFMLTCPNFVVNSETYERNCRWNSCWFGKAAITSVGDVLPCIFARDQVAGNVKRQSLSEIILGKRMFSFWSLTKDQVEVCKDCEYRYVCKDCRPWTYGFTGNLHAKSPRCTYNPYTGEWAKTEALVQKLVV